MSSRQSAQPTQPPKGATPSNGELSRDHRETVERSRVLLCDIIQALVDNPAQVRVSALAGGRTVIFKVTTHPEDVRRLIGRKGRTAVALRELLIGLAGKAKLRYKMSIDDSLPRQELEERRRAQRQARH